MVKASSNFIGRSPRAINMIPTEINDRKRKKGRLVGGMDRRKAGTFEMRGLLKTDLFRSRRMRRMRDSAK